MTAKPRTLRYIVISIPGRRDDGKDTWWSVFDRKRHRAVPDAVLPGEGGRIKLATLARAMSTPKHRSHRSSGGQANKHRQRNRLTASSTEKRKRT